MIKKLDSLVRETRQSEQQQQKHQFPSPLGSAHTPSSLAAADRRVRLAGQTRATASHGIPGKAIHAIETTRDANSESGHLFHYLMLMTS